MSSYEEVSAILAEIGPELDVVEIAAVEEEQSWLIAVDDTTEQTVALTRDEQTGKLFISTPLGQPPEGNLQQTCEHMLAYNLGWSETDGARIGREPELGEFVLLHDVVLNGLTADGLGIVIANFIQASMALRSLVVAGIGDGEPAEGAREGMADSGPHPAIRV